MIHKFIILLSFPLVVDDDSPIEAQMVQYFAICFVFYGFWLICFVARSDFT